LWTHLQGGQPQPAGRPAPVARHASACRARAGLQRRPSDRPRVLLSGGPAPVGLCWHCPCPRLPEGPAPAGLRGCCPCPSSPALLRPGLYALCALYLASGLGCTPHSLAFILTSTPGLLLPSPPSGALIRQAHPCGVRPPKACRHSCRGPQCPEQTV